MPTVVTARGFAVRVNLIEDGDGPHVHVYKGGREYRVQLMSNGGKVLTSGGRERTTRSEARAALRVVIDNLDACWEEWRRWHE